jgi:hypothetical protein
MTTPLPSRPRVLIDTDVLFAGAASPSEHGASLIVLRLAELTLIDALCPEQVIIEGERNLAAKLPEALPLFRMLVTRCLRVMPDPTPEDLCAYRGLADSKDLPILVTGIKHNCRWLVTFNVSDYHPGHPNVTVVRPGDFVRHVRSLMAHLAR